MALAPPGLLLFVFQIWEFMLQKFTKKTTFYYKQISDLGNLYQETGQKRTLNIGSLKPKLHPKEPFTTDIKKPAGAGFLPTQPLSV